MFVRSETNLPVKGSRVKVQVGDIQDYQSLLVALKGGDVVFHLAAITVSGFKSWGFHSTQSKQRW
jgi:nucleoside-diphosphate-sugar epimerase